MNARCGVRSQPVVRGSSGTPRQLENGGYDTHLPGLDFGEPGGSSPTGWLVLGVLLMMIPLRVLSLRFLMEATMKTQPDNAPSGATGRTANLKLVTGAALLVSAVLETAWAFSISWSAGAIGPTPWA